MNDIGTKITSLDTICIFFYCTALSYFGSSLVQLQPPTCDRLNGNFSLTILLSVMTLPFD